MIPDLRSVPSLPRPVALQVTDCQPSADAACGSCVPCREVASQRFDALLERQLDAIRRSMRPA